MGVKLGKTQGHRQKSVELLLVTSRREKPSDTAEPTVSAVLDGDKLVGVLILADLAAAFAADQTQASPD